MEVFILKHALKTIITKHLINIGAWVSFALRQELINELLIDLDAIRVLVKLFDLDTVTLLF